MKQKKAIKRCLDCEQVKKLNRIKHVFLEVFFGFDPQIDWIGLSGPSPGTMIPGDPEAVVLGGALFAKAERIARLKTFLDQRMSAGLGKKIQASVFYKEFVDFWRVNYPGDPLPSNTCFGRHVARLAGSGPFAGIFKNKTNGSIYYNGIGAR
jgi:hypothetical protein